MFSDGDESNNVDTCNDKSVLDLQAANEKTDDDDPLVDSIANACIDNVDEEDDQVDHS